MSEEIVNSAFSFSDLLGLTLREKSKNNKFIKTWKINTNNIESEIQNEEETNQENSSIAISEEYEI